MPAVDYDYNYYSNARKVNKTASTKRATNKVDSSIVMASNKKNVPSNRTLNTTRQTTKEQVRKAMYEAPKSQSSASNRKNVKRNNVLDIPQITHGKKANVSEKGYKNYTTEKSRKSKNYTKPAEMKLKKPAASAVQKKKSKEKAVSRVKNVLYLCVGFAIAFLICYRYSLINERFNQLEKTKDELATAQTVNEQIQADIDSQTDLSYIENYAKYQLGMQKPSNSQIVYVNVEKEDRILTPVTIEETSTETWLDKLYEEIVKLFE